MKKLLLTLAFLFSFIGVFAQGSADFNTMNNGNANSSYQTRESTDGWVATNAALIQLGDFLAPTLNGKTSAVGVITSPTLNNGLGELAFSYENTFSESNGVSVRIDIMQNGKVAKTQTLTNKSVTQNTQYDFKSSELSVEGDFQIVITNLAPSNNSSSNKDRVSIFNLRWSAYGSELTEGSTGDGGGDDGGDDGGDTPTPSDNSADFNTMNGGKAITTYSTYTSTDGWVAANSCLIQLGDFLAPTLNGKTTSVGTLTSPTLHNGIGTLSFDYENTYSESKGVSVRIDIKQGNSVVKTQTLTNTSVTQNTKYSFTSDDFNVTGDFVIVITNLSPSNTSSSNKDRVSIFNLTWTSYGNANLQDPEISYSETAFTVDNGATFTAPTLTNPNQLTVTYESDNTAVATVNETTGDVTIVGPGTATITASSEETSQFNAGTASYTITVLAIANSIEEAYQVAQDTQMKINFPMTVAFKNYNNTYATDGTNFTQIYSQAVSSTFPDYAVGDVIPEGWTATYTLYNNVTPELVPVTVPGASTQNNGFTPQEVTSVTNEMVNEVVMIKNVEITTATPATKDTFVVGDVTYYNNYTLPSQQPGKYDILGVVSIYRDAPQLNVISFTKVVEPVVVSEVNPQDGKTLVMEEIEEVTVMVTFSGPATVNSAKVGKTREQDISATPNPAFGETATDWTFVVPASYIKSLILGYNPEDELKLGFNLMIAATYNDGNQDVEINDGLIELTYYIETDIQPGVDFTVTVEDNVDSELNTFTVAPGVGYNSIVASNELTQITITGEDYSGNVKTFDNGTVTFSPAITKSGTYTINFPLNAFTVGNSDGNTGEETEGNLGGDEFYPSQAKTQQFTVTVENESDGPVLSGDALVLNDDNWYPEANVHYYYKPTSNGTLKLTIGGPGFDISTTVVGGIYDSEGVLTPSATDGSFTDDYYAMGPAVENASYIEYALMAGVEYYFTWIKNNGSQDYTALFTWEASDEPSVEPIPDGAFVVYNNGELSNSVVTYGWWNQSYNFNATNPEGEGSVFEFKAGAGGFTDASMGLDMGVPTTADDLPQDYKFMNTGVLHNATLNFDWYALGTGTYTIRLTCGKGQANEFNYDFTVTAETAGQWNTESIDIAEKWPGLAEAWNNNENLGEGYVFSVILSNGKEGDVIYFNRVYYTNVDEDWVAPTVDIPEPETVPEADVEGKDYLSFFSMLGSETFNYGYDWGFSTSVVTKPIDDNVTLFLTNFDYLGIVGFDIDISEYDYMHIDYWTPDEGTKFGFTPISLDPTKEQIWNPEGETVTPNQWNSYDAPLSYFSEAGVDLTSIKQIKLVANEGTANPKYAYIANIYFWKEEAAAEDNVLEMNFVASGFDMDDSEINDYVTVTDWVDNQKQITIDTNPYYYTEPEMEGMPLIMLALEPIEGYTLDVTFNIDDEATISAAPGEEEVGTEKMWVIMSMEPIGKDFVATITITKDEETPQPEEGAAAYLGTSTGSDVPTLNEDYPLTADADGNYTVAYTIEPGTNFNIWVKNETTPAGMKRKVNAEDYTAYGPSEITTLTYTSAANSFTNEVSANNQTYWTVGNDSPLKLDISFNPESGEVTATNNTYIAPEGKIGYLQGEDVDLTVVLSNVEQYPYPATVNVPVSLEMLTAETFTYSGFQFNVTTPQGFTLTNAALNDKITNATLSSRNGRIVMYCDENENLTSAFNDYLVMLTFTKVYNAAPKAGTTEHTVGLSQVIFSSEFTEELTVIDGAPSIITEVVSTGDVLATGIAIQSSSLNTPSWNKRDNFMENNLVQYVTKGQSIDVVFAITPADATTKTAVFSSSNDGVTFSTLENGATKVTVFTDGFAGNSEQTVTITAKVQAPDGESTIEGVEATYSLKVKPVMEGDANDNGYVTVSDVNDISDYVSLNLGSKALVFDAPNADANSDETVDAADVTVAVNIVKGGAPVPSSLRRKAPTMTGDALVVEDFKVKSLEPFAIGVGLDNTYKYTSLQALVKLPEGMELVEVTPGSRAAGHTLKYGTRSYDGAIMVLLYSGKNELFAEGEGELFNLVVKATEECDDILMASIKGADINANSYTLTYEGGKNLTETTGVDGIEAEGDGVRYFTIDGIEIQNPEAGQVVIKVADGKAEKVVIK